MDSIRNIVQNTSKTFHLLFVLKATMVLPFIVHLLPSINGIPIGAILLPMFYISIPAMYLFKDTKLVALGVGLAPILNHLMTGRPDISLMIILTFELVVYSLLVGQMLRSKYKLIRIYVGGLSYLSTKILSSLCLYLPFKMINMDGGVFFFTSIVRAFPGIILLLVISHICNKTLSEHD